nr:uncharacterized protein LOC111427609 [Onthophagus taurus]
MRESVERIRKERASPTSPRLILRRVLVLAEGRQYREASAVISKLGSVGLVTLASELPLDLLVEGLPHSAQLLETLFSKLVATGQRPNLNAEPVLWQLVRLFALHEDPGLKSKLGRLAQVLLEFQPEFFRVLSSRRKTLEQAVQGLGCHGLTQTASGLTHLHAALKSELQRHIETYKAVLHRLDELGLCTNDTKKPVDASHQRLLSLHHNEVQQRLIDNKTILTLMDKPALQQLKPLIEMLMERVQNDKEALFCVSQLKRMHSVVEDRPVAQLLMCFSRACSSVLELMQLPESPCHSDGYHSEPETDADREKDAVGRFASLYYQSRPRALESLDDLPDLTHANQLKSKILFSVVVLAFRTCRHLKDTKLRETFRNLHIDVRNSSANLLRSTITKCFATTFDTFPLSEIETQIRNLVCDTLQEYKCLDSCEGLRRYVAEVSRTVWFLINQDPPFELETNFTIPTKFRPDLHLKHHSSDRTSDNVKCYLWPALIQSGNCVHKAVVVTDGG